ncbi:MAG: twin-arginine translocation signal domain-containing protein [Armatimonadota bacterium]|nr:twin-arginine translocation signal domain-containing protein [Armatimonadota bacterium]
MPVTRRRFLRLTAVGIVGAAAAPAAWTLLGREPASSGPPVLRYGQDRCDACGMIISDPRYAAAARDAAGVRRYDDIGCLLGHAGAALRSGQARGYVHDAETHEWLDAGAAAFVRSPAIRTPMGFGIAAYVTPQAASRAHPGTTALTLGALLEQGT